MSIEEIINKIAWWIPFKSLRNAIRGYLLYIVNLVTIINQTNLELNKRLVQLDNNVANIHKDTFSKLDNSNKDIFSKLEKSNKETFDKLDKSNKDTFSKLDNSNKDIFSKLEKSNKETFDKLDKSNKDTFSKLEKSNKETFDKLDKFNKDAFEKFEKSNKETSNKIELIDKNNSELIKNVDILISKGNSIEELIKKSNLKLPIYMSENEREVFVRAIKDSKNYIEFGSGGSTFITLKTTDAKIISVEGDPNWLDYMRNNNLVFEAEQSCRLKFYYIDIGKVGAWSKPVDDSKKELYPNYSQFIFDKLTEEEMNNIDTVLVDGRFRVASALNSIYYCRNAKIIIHDFFDRDYYHIVLDYLDIVEEADTLGVFKIKDNIDYNKVKELVKLYCYDMR